MPLSDFSAFRNFCTKMCAPLRRCFPLVPNDRHQLTFSEIISDINFVNNQHSPAKTTQSGRVVKRYVMPTRLLVQREKFAQHVMVSAGVFWCQGTTALQRWWRFTVMLVVFILAFSSPQSDRHAEDKSFTVSLFVCLSANIL